jgi:hypothetical protein
MNDTPTYSDMEFAYSLPRLWAAVSDALEGETNV